MKMLIELMNQYDNNNTFHKVHDMLCLQGVTLTNHKTRPEVDENTLKDNN